MSDTTGCNAKRAWINITVTKPIDARGWIGFGVYVLVLILLLMMWGDKTLLKDDFFKTIATLIIGTGFINGPVGWAYQATKAGSDLAASTSRIAEAASATANANAANDEAATVSLDAGKAAADAADAVAGAAVDASDQIKKDVAGAASDSKKGK